MKRLLIAFMGLIALIIPLPMAAQTYYYVDNFVQFEEGKAEGRLLRIEIASDVIECAEVSLGYVVLNGLTNGFISTQYGGAAKYLRYLRDNSLSIGSHPTYKCVYMQGWEEGTTQQPMPSPYPPFQPTFVSVKTLVPKNYYSYLNFDGSNPDVLLIWWDGNSTNGDAAHAKVFNRISGEKLVARIDKEQAERKNSQNNSVTTFTPTSVYTPVDGSSSSGASSISTQQKTRHTCGICNGSGRKVYEEWMGSSRTKWCSECGKDVIVSHHHSQCNHCYGNGYVEW